jgi:hypothetical protein
MWPCPNAERCHAGFACSGIAQSVAASALRQVLNRQDDVLGPWIPGRDPLEDALAAFAGACSYVVAAWIPLFSMMDGYCAEML